MGRAEKIAKRRRGATGAKRAFDRAWRQWQNPYPPICQFSQDQIEAIHNASLKLLSEKGIKVLNQHARDLYRSAGMCVKGDIVHFDPDGVMALLANAPPQVKVHARNPDRSIKIGGANVAISTVGGAPNFSNLQDGRKPGNLAALDQMCKLAQSFDVIHLIGPMVEPQDIAINQRHLYMTRSILHHTDKVPFVYFRGQESIEDAYEIIRLAHGISKAEFCKQPYSYAVANSNSPLVLDDLMCAGIMDAARAGQLMILTPFTLSGAMAPVSISGALVLQNAEVLGGIALAQIAKPGAPVCYGSFTSNVDMRTGSPAFGTPEFTRAAFASGQLARRYNLPFRSSGVTSANCVDAQAAYETQMSLWGALMGGANILLHGAGWLESGLTASAEKFILDVEMLQMFAELFKPLSTSADDLAMDAIKTVQHGGHFFGTEHTLERFETAFYSPLLSDWNNFENWYERGGLDATKRANAIYRDTLSSYHAPPMPIERSEAIESFIQKRIASSDG